MRFFFKLLLYATLLNIFLYLYILSPGSCKKGAAEKNFTTQLEELRKEHVVLFTQATNDALFGSLYRINIVERKFGPALVQIRVTQDLVELAVECRDAAQQQLKIVESFRDKWLGDCSLVKSELIDLLKVEIKIWDSIIGLRNLKHATVSFDQQIANLIFKSQRLEDTMKAIYAGV